jgi:hypothetical protein
MLTQLISEGDIGAIQDFTAAWNMYLPLVQFPVRAQSHQHLNSSSLICLLTFRLDSIRCIGQ